MGSITSHRPNLIRTFGIGHAILLISAFILLIPAVALWSSSGQIDGEVYTGTWITPSPTPIPPTLIAEKTAEGFSAEIDGVLLHGVVGEICVQNMGELPTEELTILDTVQIPSGADDYIDFVSDLVDLSEHPILEPGETYCYPYLIYFEPAAASTNREPADATEEPISPDDNSSPEQIIPEEPVTTIYRNQAYVTILNHAEWLPGSTNCPGPEPCPYGPIVFAPFTLPTPTPTPTPTPEPSATPTETPTPTPEGQSGTTLEAEKTAIGFQEYQNEILIAGVRGEICVTNGGEVATQNLAIIDIIETKVGGEEYQAYYTEILDLSEKPVLEPDETYCYPYEIEFTLPQDEDTLFRNVANITITNHSGWIPGGHHCPGPDLCPFGPSPRASFEIPEPEEISPTQEPVEPEVTEEPTEETPTEEPVEGDGG